MLHARECVTGVKNFTRKISIMTSIYFHPMSDRQVKKYSARLSFYECPVLFGNSTSKNLGVLVWRTSEHIKIFFAPVLAKNKTDQRVTLGNETIDALIV